MGPGGGAYQLLDLTKGTMTAVIPMQKMYMTMDFAEANDAAEKKAESHPPKITDTGKTETIAGHKCTHYLIDTEDGHLDVCAATGMGYLGMSGGGNPMARRRVPAAIPIQYRDLYHRFKDGFQPLKVEKLEGEKRSLVLEVKSIEKKPQDAALFKVPEGYRDMSGMMRGRVPRR